jgi:hypothetical protein
MAPQERRCASMPSARRRRSRPATPRCAAGRSDRLGGDREPGGSGREACAPAIRAGALFLDFNSASPGAKIRAAGLIEAAGGAMSKAR